MPRKTIYDPIHGPIAVEGVALALIQHPSFQRLWGIRQTGLAHLVFPGANHTRLEHSLGVYWVARRMAEVLGVSAAESLRVAVGGLLHDLGHGPFSHTLEPTMREVWGFGHERVTRAMLVGRLPNGWVAPTDAGPSISELLSHASIDSGRVADLVDPALRRTSPALLTAILHGAIDADRIDYLQRDAHYTGVAHGAIDATRLLDTVRPAGQRLAFAEKGRSAVEGFLVGRSLMYASVYYHKTVRAAEVMAQAAVERLPEYPASARPLFAMTDGTLVEALRRTRGASAARIQALLERRLFRRATGIRHLGRPALRRFIRLHRSPSDRRAVEDELADAFGVDRGEILLDLAGLEPRDGSGEDIANVAILEDGKITHPFREESPWRALATRPPSPWAVGVYVGRDLRRPVGARLLRALDRLLP